MDAGNDILAVAGERDLTGKDAAFVRCGSIGCHRKGPVAAGPLDDNTCVARASEV